MRQNEKWRTMADDMNRSLYSEQMVCAMSTQLLHIPETRGLKGNAEMHTSLVPASYHRVTATGSAQRLLNGESAPSIVQTFIACIQNAEVRDRNVRAGLQVMLEDASESYKPFIQNIIRWQDYAEMYLRNAKQSAMQITGAAAWQGQPQNGEVQG
ncbi:hypothetical protein [Alkalihalobacillus sp. AL-G]|uniref:hypothetical protein n=1 Tax=Alkalihalobacillus sp. AL-G TaxID=2926399 RepID=UPI00272A63CE|nr:hypothetical protein [Alkalihalobacillus sp. AL-G]WLD91692.1 hypothetical protein MOJ78_11625 [Alkalihalobacillus sp. AL-G]